jgi:DNA polymerase-3 subunit epsilon
MRPREREPSHPTFAAIDFETANDEPTSACALGIVRVEHGVIVQRWSRLIRPPTRVFAYTDIHGLSWEDVASAPSFATLWPEIRAVLAGVEFLAAHHAVFDEAVLKACCKAARAPSPRLPFECTVETARRAWGIYPTKLPIVAATLGIPLDHHDAASDAEACAEIVLRARAPRLLPAGT